jgi:cell division protein FtsB
MNPISSIFAAFICALGFAAGYGIEHRARIAEVASLKSDIAKREAEASAESRHRIEAAQKVADKTIAERDARLAELDAVNRRIRDELKTATTGRPCLSADARSVLQQSPAFSATVPAPTVGPAPATSSASENSGDSTDADVAGWIIDASALYEQCRARVDAIRQWDEVTNGVR